MNNSLSCYHVENQFGFDDVSGTTNFALRQKDGKRIFASVFPRKFVQTNHLFLVWNEFTLYYLIPNPWKRFKLDIGVIRCCEIFLNDDFAIAMTSAVRYSTTMTSFRTWKLGTTRAQFHRTLSTSRKVEKRTFHIITLLLPITQFFLLINKHSAMRGTQTRDSNESTAWGLVHQFCNIYI